MRVSYKHFKKRLNDPPTASSAALSGLGGVVTETAAPAPSFTGLVTYTAATSVSIPPTTTYTHSATSSPTPSPSPSTSASPSSDISSNSAIPVGTVVGACVGAFAGLGLLIYLFYLYSKRSLAASNNGKPERGENWKKLNDGQDRWDGSPNSPSKDSAREMVEKNRALFKKSSPSIRTTRTKLSDEDHPYDLPPFEFSKYHPNLAQELALEKPAPAFAGDAVRRGQSGVSWDGTTMHDDSFLSMRSVRVDSGTMSPTLVMAKPTPVATFHTEHRWESAEVLTLEEENAAGPKEVEVEVQNPFLDATEQRRSVANPFFNAQDLRLQRSRSSRVRSVSDAHSRSSRATSTRRSTLVSNPFTDVQEVPLYRVSPPASAHTAPGRTGSPPASASGAAFGEKAMKSLIAALELSQEEVEERLRVVSMQGSTLSRFSMMTAGDEETDIVTVRQFPMPPSSDEGSRVV